MDTTDSYKTISRPSEETLFKEKGSKFYGYAFPVKTESDVEDCLAALKTKHKSARHFCYAYQVGTENLYYRANDDGEPSNSAGMPIYGQLQSFDVTNVLVVVVRYFGGTKLGVGGLISAYKESAKLSLEAAKIVEKTIDIHFKITFDYKDINKVMRILKEKNIAITRQDMHLDCTIYIAVRKSEAPRVAQLFEQLYGVTIKEVENNDE